MVNINYQKKKKNRNNLKTRHSMPLLEQANRINNIMQICYSIFNKNNQIYMFEKKPKTLLTSLILFITR